VKNVIVVEFDTAEEAHEGGRALQHMHRDGSVTLYEAVVVVREPGGKLVVQGVRGLRPLGTVCGMLTGAVIGLLGGPLGAALGLGAGTLAGIAFDVTRERLDEDFVEEVGARLRPGAGAAIAEIGEIDERWQAPLETQTCGERLRRARRKIVDACLEQDIQAARRELALLEVERLAAVKASRTEEAKRKIESLQARIYAAKWSLRQKEHEFAARKQALRDAESESIAVPEAQKPAVTAASRALPERRRAQPLRDALDRHQAAHATAQP